MKVMNIFYGVDLLPYKDKERSVHYPIVNNEFLGASQVSSIHFYIDRIGSSDDTWVANTKLPNGKYGNELLKAYYDAELEEHYVALELSSFYTQAKGNVYISLNAFFGGVDVEKDENDVYRFKGVPTIKATGVINIPIHYAVPLSGSDEVETITLSQILDEVGNKLPRNSETTIKVVSSINQIDDPRYKSLFTNYGATYIVYAIAQDKLYSATKQNVYASIEYEEITYNGNVQANSLVATSSLNSYATTSIVFNRTFDIATGKTLNEVYQTLEKALDDIKKYQTNTYLGTIYDELGLMRVFYTIDNDNLYFCFLKSINEIVVFSRNEYVKLGYAVSQTLAQTFTNRDLKDVFSYAPIVVASSTQLSDEQVRIATQNNSIIIYQNYAYYKVSETRFVCPNLEISSSSSTSITQKYLLLDITNKQLTYSQQEVSFYDIIQSNSKFGVRLESSVDPTTYVLTFKLYSTSGDLLSSTSIDLPLESIVSSATYYDSYTYNGRIYEKVIVLSLTTTSEKTIIPVGGLVEGLVSTSTLESRIATRLEKLTSPNNLPRVYGYEGSTQTSYATDNNNGEQMVYNALVKRNGTGQIRVPLVPTDNNHATSKKYVDDLVSNVLTYEEALAILQGD